MLDVMLDLETMGTGPRAAVVAIGAVEFDLAAGEIGERFYRVIDLADAVRNGGEMDASTVLWWMRQSDEARAAFSNGAVSLGLALLDFSAWMGQRGDLDDVRVWGNGPAFDNVILGSAYRAMSLPQPWRYRNDRCFRTVAAQHPERTFVPVGVHHNAVDDAESQARHLVAIARAPAAVQKEQP